MVLKGSQVEPPLNQHKLQPRTSTWFTANDSMLTHSARKVNIVNICLMQFSARAVMTSDFH